MRKLRYENFTRFVEKLHYIWWSIFEPPCMYAEDAACASLALSG